MSRMHPHSVYRAATTRTRWLLALALAACGGGEGAGEAEPAAGSPDLPINVTGVGFATPESVLHDAQADVYLVSNINGTPVDEDDNGFISRISPDGTVMDLRWIDGASSEVTLNAPKGMALVGSVLYVADIDCIRAFDRVSGAPLVETCPPGVAFLNDMAPAPDGTSAYFTDSGLDASFAPTGADAVYRLSGDGQVTAVARDASLGAPNGVAVGARGILVATFGSGEVYALEPSGNRTVILPASQRQFDGIEALPDGGFLVSSWGDQAVSRVAADGTEFRIVEGIEAPADIGVDRTRNRVLIPLFNANEVRIVPLGNHTQEP